MSNVCCQELKGWCNSFTRTELYLSLIQVLFLVVLISSLTFIILHFIACSENKEKNVINDNIEKSTITSTTEAEKEQVLETSTEIYVATSKQTQLPKEIECTWTPSHKTKAVTHYYDADLTTTIEKQKVTEYNKIFTNKLKSSLPIFEDDLDKSYDGEVVDEVKKGFLLALVKIRPPQDITFGCTLTVVGQKWTITAASCIEAIEEVDTLDSFVMMQGFGEKNEGNIYGVSDIQIHPQYQGVNKTYDLAALKSEDNIVKDSSIILTLPTSVDYLLTTVGQRFSILGYGKFRNFDKDLLSRKIREASVYRLPLKQCPGEGEAWSPRHLWGGRRVQRAGCGGAPLCAGALRARARPCHYCAGAPLLHARTLLALMADNPHCGLDCEPALYVNLALLRDWLDAIIYSA